MHVKYLLTPTTSNWLLYDKLTSTPKRILASFNRHVIYGMHDIIDSEAGEDIVESNSVDHSLENIQYHQVAESGHNLYL